SNTGKAESAPPPTPAARAETPPAEQVATPGPRTIDEVARVLGVEPARLLKTLLYEADGQPVAAEVRGDHVPNEVKLKRIVVGEALEMASAERIQSVTGAPVGFSGPVGLKGVRIVADPWAWAVADAVAGANAADAHLIHVQPGRDWQ